MLRKIVLTTLTSAILLCGQVPSETDRLTPAIFPTPVPAYAELKQYLALTDVQLQRLRDIVAEDDRARQEVYRQMQEKQTELNGLLASGSRDAAYIGQLMIDIQSLRKQVSLPSGQWRDRALAVLTPEQRIKLVPLDQAMKLASTAYQAVSLKLIDGPPLPRAIVLPTPLFEPAPAPLP